MATPKKSTTKSGSTSTPKKSSSSSSTSSSNGRSASKLGANKGKVLAAGAGVAAAAVAAGVAYFRGNRGSENGRAVYHVQPASEGWQVKGDSAERAVSNHGTKKEALTAARELAHSKVPSQLVVHKSDGSVQESWTYDSE